MVDASLNKLLNKYDVPGPRYTSYPTVPAWQEGIQVQDYQSSLQALGPQEPLSLYFHLPFCEKLCHFCGCMKVITNNHSRSQPYVAKLIAELKLVAAQFKVSKAPVSQIHFGGGTPNFCQPAEITSIINTAQELFDIQADAEIAIEMHPRTSTHEFCDNLKELGFNRISLGVQDFSPKVQRLINRHQDYDMTATMVNYLRKLGFNSFNFDLIYGLPGQTTASWEQTLLQVLALKPNRLAVYSYAHVPWKAPVQRSFKDSDLPSPELKLTLFETAFQHFTENGYRLIGMDHFALADDELSQAANTHTLHRNFMGYSTRANAHQIGLGVSAISYVNGNYFQNQKELPDYEATIDQDQLATYRGYLLNQDDLIRRSLITEIMCNGYVDFNAFNQQWKINFADYFATELQQLTAFITDNLLEVTEQQLQVINHGFLFLRNIAMIFDQYLAGIQAEARTPTFSRTV